MYCRLNAQYIYGIAASSDSARSICATGGRRRRERNAATFSLSFSLGWRHTTFLPRQIYCVRALPSSLSPSVGRPPPPPFNSSYLSPSAPLVSLADLDRKTRNPFSHRRKREHRLVVIAALIYCRPRRRFYRETESPGKDLEEQ